MKKVTQITILSVIILSIGLFFNNNSVQAYTEEEYTQKLEESVSYALSLIDDKMTDHEKALIFIQYCQEGNIYSDKSSGNGQIATDVLVDHKAVCAGYAESFKLLCTAAGIPCETLRSYKANHKWCVCYLDGDWTYVDTTRGPSGSYAPQVFSVSFYSKDEFDFVTVKEGGQTSAKNAKENGWTIIDSKYFTDAFYDSGGLNDNYYPEGSSWSGSKKITGNYSRVYYDETYRYYEQAPIRTGSNRNDSI